MKIQETTFGPKLYLTLRKKIATNEITDKAMYDQAGHLLGTYVQQHNIRVSGPWSVLYFFWDEAIAKAEIGICFPVEGLMEVHDAQFSLVNLPRTKAAMAILRGPYQGLGNTHKELGRYIAEKKLDTTAVPVIAVEEYVTSPMAEPNPKNYITNVYYLHS